MSIRDTIRKHVLREAKEPEDLEAFKTRLQGVVDKHTALNRDFVSAKPVQPPAPPPSDEHEKLLTKHGFEYAAQDVDDSEESDREWVKFNAGEPHKEDHQLESYWEAYHGEHPATGKTHCVWIYPNHKQGLHWVHGEGDPNEQMAHDLGAALHPHGLAANVPPEPPPMKQHEGFGLNTLAKHLQKHFPIQ